MPTQDDLKFAAKLVLIELVSREDIQKCLKLLDDAGEEGDLAAIVLEQQCATEAEIRSAQGVSLTKIQPIADYHLKSRIAEGGMAVVYEAIYLPLKDPVALKVMKPELARHERYRLRFLREAKLLENLEHENIVAGYDARRSGEYYYYAMEHVDGATVEERIDRDGPFDERLALYVTREVCRALCYLHRRGVIHRDLKPGNFLLTEGGAVKIIDLGLAKLPAGMIEDSDEGVTVGTAEYLSPEQARGRGDVDGRSDIYSLGVSLFHMVVGEVPFKGETNQEVIAKQVLSALDRPELKSRKISAQMHYLIQRMMAKDRGDRFQTPEEVIAEIEEKAGDVSDAIRKGPVLKARPVLERRPLGRRGASSSRRKGRGRRGRRK